RDVQGLGRLFLGGGEDHQAKRQRKERRCARQQESVHAGLPGRENDVPIIIAGQASRNGLPSHVCNTACKRASGRPLSHAPCPFMMGCGKETLITWGRQLMNGCWLGLAGALLSLAAGLWADATDAGVKKKITA